MELLGCYTLRGYYGGHPPKMVPLFAKIREHA
jgi:hypothetical protein